MKKQPWIFPCGKYMRESKVQETSSYPSAGSFLFVQEMDIVGVICSAEIMS